MGLTGIPPLSLLGRDVDSNRAIYWTCLLVLVAIAALQTRLLHSHLGRTLRAVREDEIAAQSYGVDLDRYKALAFAFGGFAAGVAGAITAHLYSYLNSQTFDSQLSLLALTMVILGGMGNVLGAIVGAVVLVALPELFRVAAEYRILIYGVVLLLLVDERIAAADAYLLPYAWRLIGFYTWTANLVYQEAAGLESHIAQHLRIHAEARTMRQQQVFRIPGELLGR